MQRRTPHIDRSPRRGILAPAVGVAILAIGLCLALLLDRLWLDAARSELQTAAEAAALAAAGRLADDDTINASIEPESISDAARQAAAIAAAENPVGGHSLQLDVSPGGDVRLGKISRGELTGAVQMLETDYFPTSVAVLARRTRAIGNPVARLFSKMTGSASESASVLVEATVNNRVLGVRPVPGGAVPAWPLAILEADPTGRRQDTWVDQIENGLGPDQYLFNSATGKVEEGEDGLPEIALHFLPPGGKADDANVQFVDLQTGFDDDVLKQQIQRGWTAADLAEWDGEFVTFNNELQLPSNARLTSPVSLVWNSLIGQKRIVLLYDGLESSGSESGRVTISRLVSGRVMAVKQAEDGSPVVILQAAVVATRMALVFDPDGTAHDADEFANPYVYKISLTQ